MSAPSRPNAARALPVTICKSISGWRAWKSASRGISQAEAKNAVVPTTRTRLAGGEATRAEAASIWRKALRTGGRKSRPASVSWMRRFMRRNSATPRCCSSVLTIWLTAPGVTHSSSAAAFTDRWRAAASKARKAFSGGNLDGDTMFSFSNAKSIEIMACTGLFPGINLQSLPLYTLDQA